jgi:hypothetical protein
MRHEARLWAVVILCVFLSVVLLWRVLSLESRLPSAGGANTIGLAVPDSVKRIEADLATVKELTPGLGEYMTIIQLHAAKLWFAAKASNWELADYELHELEETMETVKKLNVHKNGIKISSLMEAILQTQIAELEKSIEQKRYPAFEKSYDETLSACNGCHSEAGYKFIRIIRPAAPPVTNQKWEFSAN